MAVNAEKVVVCRRDPLTRKLVQAATLRYADGAGVVLAMRTKGVRGARVPGVDLWLEILRVARGRELAIALIGAAPDILAETRRRLEKEFPDIGIRLSRDGFAGSSDFERLAIEIRAAAPQIIFVAKGSPAQEDLILKLREVHPQGFYLGLGGSFDIYSGRKRRAPLWMQRCGFEWVYRFLKEPARAPREAKRLAFLGLLLRGQL